MTDFKAATGERLACRVGGCIKVVSLREGGAVLIQTTDTTTHTTTSRLYPPEDVALVLSEIHNFAPLTSWLQGED